MSIPVIDIFAGPGGLGEGFCSVFDKSGKRVFRIALSIEKDVSAHQTLLLRSFTRQFERDEIPTEYYQFVRGETNVDILKDRWPRQWQTAEEESWHATIGEEDGGISPTEVDRRIKRALRGAREWVLVGGPPCQAYSIVGRSRTGGIRPDDPRVYLYREYYRILAVHAPPIFVMENVKGLLSARLNQERIFDQILRDLKDPADSYAKLKGRAKVIAHHGYRIFSLTSGGQMDILGSDSSLRDYVVKCEDYGIPQKRHRVILLGVRSDINVVPNVLKRSGGVVSLSLAIKDLPRIRGGLSERSDADLAWKTSIARTLNNGFSGLSGDVRRKIQSHIRGLRIPRWGRGSEFIPSRTSVEFLKDWYFDRKLGGVCNHHSKEHMEADLQRYFFAACFAQIHRRSPKLGDFPERLLPKHENAQEGVRGEKFADRFRVQLWREPATTITSHLAKDGHYYIHPDPMQCRSLTVREAARLQTFPDNYFFCGPKTEQYKQVGNAVPPLLARQIASIVHRLFPA